MIRIESNRLLLKELSLDDITDRYISWLNDPVVNQFLESRFVKHTYKSNQKFIKEIDQDPYTVLFGIFDKKNMKHIGNIKISSSNKDRLHRRASIGFIIGEKSEWGKGYATEAIRVVTKYGFDNLNAIKIYAGCRESNIGSKKAMEKAGYSVEGFYRNHFETKKGREGGWQLGIFTD
jgi:[ribosomal protein S5]-alanine N-acetyltransferase